MSQSEQERRWGLLECDSATLTGAVHAREATPSQDCAVHGATDAVAWGVVCDGCSSGDRTDFGARLWALAVERDLGCADSRLLAALAQGAALGPVLAEIAPEAPAGLGYPDMLATVVAVCATRDQVWGLLSGDGMVVGIYADGSLDIVEHVFTRSTPFYPEYLRLEHAMHAFISSSRSSGQLMRVVRTRVASTGQVADQQQEIVPIDAEQEFAGVAYLLSHNDSGPAEGALVAALAMTDGVGSRPKGSCLATVKELCGHRAWRRDFVRKRLGQLGREWSKDHSPPRDDLAIAGLAWPALL